MPTRTRLTDEQVWAILNAPDDLHDRDLAVQLGATYSAVHGRRWNLRMKPWACRISWEPCQHCGNPLIRPTSTKRYHDQCRPEVLRELNASYHPARQERMTPVQLAARDARRDAYYKRTQAETLPRAVNQFQPYSTEDEARILEMSETMTLEQIALEMGRSRAAIMARLKVVRGRRA